MIFNIDANFLFVHIPRTGGIAVTDALLSAFPDSYVDVTAQRHRYAMGCRGVDRLGAGKVWSRLYKFAIVRNPWEIIESDFRLLTRDVATLHSHSKMECDELWYKKLVRVGKYKSFSEFAAREYLGRDIVWDGGFWRTWCCDPTGESLGIDILRYENLEHDWQRVCRQLGINQKLDHMNSAEYLHYATKYLPTVLQNLGVDPPEIHKINLKMPFPCEWTPAVRDAIGELCYLDVEKFDYEFHGQLAS